MAVTAYSRIYINRYKNIPGNKLHYTATDSVHLQHPLPLHQVGSDLGMMKLEANIKRAIYLRANFYGYVTDSNIEVLKHGNYTKASLTFNDFVALLAHNSVNITTQTSSIKSNNVYIKSRSRRVMPLPYFNEFTDSELMDTTIQPCTSLAVYSEPVMSVQLHKDTITHVHLHYPSLKLAPYVSISTSVILYNGQSWLAAIVYKKPVKSTTFILPALISI